MSESAIKYMFSKERREVEETEARLARERQRDTEIAQAHAFHDLADLQMPADLRERAREWNMEAFMEAVWRAGWQSGYRVRRASQEVKP